MEISNVNLVYFSAGYTTRKIMRQIAAQISIKTIEHDITMASAVEEDVVLNNDDLLVVGVPVYAGRIPAESRHNLSKFKGNSTPAVIVCVYGNRDYDDALLELKDTVESNGFVVVSAASFIARHAIFPEVGASRPDDRDIELIKDFAGRSMEIVRLNVGIENLPAMEVKGNKPYKVPGKIPLNPTGSSRCSECGTCVSLCPVQAIAADTPRKTDKEKCIACGRCIIVCPSKARHFGGIVYKIAQRKFVKAYSARKEPEMIFAER